VCHDQFTSSIPLNLATGCSANQRRGLDQSLERGAVAAISLCANLRRRIGVQYFIYGQRSRLIQVRCFGLNLRNVEAPTVSAIPTDQSEWMDNMNEYRSAEYLPMGGLAA